MKLQIKLNKSESEAFKAFAETVKPSEIGDAEFLKSIFFKGLETMNEQLIEMTKSYIDDHREELEASGFSFDTSGEIASVGFDDPEGMVEVVDSTEEE